MSPTQIGRFLAPEPVLTDPSRARVHHQNRSILWSTFCADSRVPNLHRSISWSKICVDIPLPARVPHLNRSYSFSDGRDVRARPRPRATPMGCRRLCCYCAYLGRLLPTQIGRFAPRHPLCSDPSPAASPTHIGRFARPVPDRSIRLQWSPGMPLGSRSRKTRAHPYRSLCCSKAAKRWRLLPVIQTAEWAFTSRRPRPVSFHRNLCGAYKSLRHGPCAKNRSGDGSARLRRARRGLVLY